MFTVVVPFPFPCAASSAITRIRDVTSFAPEPVAPEDVPQRTQVQRIKLIVNETRDVPVAVSISSFIVVSPEIASALLKNPGSLRLTALHVGETILIVFDGQRRYTFLVEVVGRTYVTTQGNTALPRRSAVEQGEFSGVYALSYSTSFAGAPSLFRQSFEFQRKLRQGRILRLSSETFKFMGQENRERVRATTPDLAVDRISLGLDSVAGAIDFFDSQISISPLSFNNYAMRGFHLVSTPKSRLRGLEVFAGQSRPSLFLFDKDQGQLAGLVLPIAERRSWRVRAELLTVVPQHHNLGRRGTVWQMDGRYTRNENLAAEGEVAYADGGLSWRARSDLQYGNVNASGEILRLNRNSPLISIGAQPGGRQTEIFTIRWRPTKSFNASLHYNHTAITQPATAVRVALDRTTLFASVSYRISHSSRVGFRYTEQQIETGIRVITSRFRLESRTANISHDIRFNPSWGNNFEARLNFSREAQVNAETERGFNLNDQLRFSWRGGSATGFINYTHRSPSLTGLIIRNPQLLPSLLRDAFTANPVLFLQRNRDTLDALFSGVELPQTRGLDLGVRLQAAFSRINLGGECRYTGDEIFAHNQRNLLASVSMNMRLDVANSVQLGGSRSFASDVTGRQSSLTISYVHRFGAGSGEGFQFSRFFGLDRGVIQGRVFFDLNGNGRDDPEEPGMAGIRVQIDGHWSVITDERGCFRFKMNPGEYSVAIVSDDLGVRMRASTLTEQQVSLSARQTVKLGFGVSNSGSLAGQIFNDLSLTGERTTAHGPSVAGVKISLRPVGTRGAPLSLTVDASGAYQFRNLVPGSYTLQIDDITLPASFRVPAQTSWPVTIQPLLTFYLDIALAAQRAVTGVVFIDKDGDGKFNPQTDEPIEGARVMAAQLEVITSKTGTYILRDLPVGRIEVLARTRLGTESLPLTIDLGAGPVTRRAVNLAVRQH
ncbi:MAG TPA: SdrD B-like domain-containing protein [Pyrinomonadaceae bacterium]|nr:SdrD B-like domain-containing protein [Pyrinomonadaceae bacterium]